MTSILLPVANTLAQTVGSTAESYEIPTVPYINGGQQVFTPDWSQITWSNLPPISEPGWIRVPTDFVKKLGYDPSRIWSAGDRPAQFIKLGDLASAFHPEAFRLEDITDLTGLATETLNLEDFKLTYWQSPSSLVKANPALGKLPISQVQPINDLLGAAGAQVNGGETIADIARDQVLGKLPLGEYLDLSKYDLNSIPGLSKTPIHKFQAWQQSFISQVPGLSNVPLAQMPLPLSIGNIQLAYHDVTWSSTEQGDPTAPTELTLSGSVNRKDKVVPVPCDAGKPCRHVELSDPLGANGSMYGKRWVSGKVQKVKGGFGPLRVLNGGWEPTGLLVYGSAFKVVLLDTNESLGSASYGLYFRACSNIPFYGKSCSPYFIGPIPWLPTQEKGLVIVASTSAPDVDIPSKYQDQINEIRQQYEPQTSPDSEVGEEVAIDGSCVEQLIAASPSSARANATSSIPLILAEAQTAGLTPAQTAYVLATVQRESQMGRLMHEIGKGGGRHGQYYGRGFVQLTWEYNYRYWSNRLNMNLVNNPDLAARPDIAAKILVYGMRDGAYTGVTPSGTLTPGGGFKLSDFINSKKTDFYQAQQIVNDHDVPSEIAKNAERYYKVLQQCSNLPTSGGVTSGSNRSTGKLLNPVSNGVVTSEYGWRTHPIRGTRKFHKGIDLGAARGTPTVAADSGVVNKVVTGCVEGNSSCGGFYGNLVEIQHSDGTKTVYAHLQRVDVKKGQQVSQKQSVGTVGSTGGSTGPHLHFEVLKGGKHVNPKDYVPL